MNKLSAIIVFIKEKRKILASLFLIIGMFSSIIFVMILSKRPQDIRSKASESSDNLPPSEEEFVSPKAQYKLFFDQRQWTHLIQPDETFGLRVVFNLNKEYGSARLDIVEGESGKTLDSLKDEIIRESALIPAAIESTQFKEKPSYLVSYKNEILGQDSYYYQQIVKEENRFFIFEKRVPQLGYDQSYLDNLLQGIMFSGSESSREVKGLQDVLADLTTVELVDLIRPSVANIVYVFCLEINNLKAELSGLINPKYNFCALAKGSGFIVHEKGVVATNGHVVKIYPEEGLVTNLLYEGNKLFSTDLIRGIYLSKGQNPTQNQVEDFYKETNLNPQYLDRFLTEIFRLIKDGVISVNIINEKYYINVGSEPVKVDYQKINQGDYIGAVIPSSTTYSAELLGFDYQNRYSYDAIVDKNYFRGADVALLQIDNPSNNLFPALELGNIENLREGSEVVVAGYPTLVEGVEDPRAAISYKTSTKPTISRGIVSAVKEDLTGKVILQTDASIDHGNSGGPAFNQSGWVIGIATFAEESQTGNFNFLRDVAEIRELMSKNSIDNKLGDLTNYWRMGLSEFRNKYYKNALEDFKQVETLSPSHPTVKDFIKLSEKAIARGESLEGSNIILIIFGSLSIVSFMSAGFLTILPLFAHLTKYKDLFQ